MYRMRLCCKNRILPTSKLSHALRACTDENPWPAFGKTLTPEAARTHARAGRRGDAPLYRCSVHDAVLARLIFKLSLSSGYAALVLAGLSLLVGPWYAWRNRRGVPVHLDVRRDIGLWAGFMSIAHVGVGLFVHLRGRPWLYFIYPPEQQHTFPLRHDLFGFANYAGLAATLVVLLLLALPNDYALRRLGRHRWKALQRWNYIAFGLILAHAIAYEFIENRAWPYVAFFAAVVLVTLAAQGIGYRTMRSKHLSTRAEP